ncbi:hypothetical protein FGO68_gene1508 [Halteria grandinella]|uniref:Uncharacterized protein n=1 Tax=Halteria grandinella TaxID=5974 RepID=A0A8J8T936_HALGN|nr:hypothetical protein FGO68_gene1508 [Halteria grandinella]
MKENIQVYFHLKEQQLYQLQMQELPFMLLLAFLAFLRLSLEACTTSQASFPKLVGGIEGETRFFQLDYRQGYLVAGGESYDPGLRGDSLGTSVSRPIAVAYKEPSYNYLWGKVFTSFSDVNTIMELSINSAGTRLVVANKLGTRRVIVMDISNGIVISSTSFSTSWGLEWGYRHLLLLNSGQILMGDLGTIKIITPITTAAILYTLAGAQTIFALRTNSAQTYLQVYSYETSKCMISLVNLSTFTNVFQMQVECQSSSVFNVFQTFRTCSIFEISNKETFYFQEDTRFFKISFDYSSNELLSSMFHDSESPSLKGRDLLCISASKLYSLMYGSYSTDSTNRIFVAEVDLTKKIVTYRRYLQEATSILDGILFESDKFFIATYTQSSIKTSPSSSFLFTQPHAAIYSPILTCQQVDELVYPENTLIEDSYSFTTTSFTFSSSPLSASDSTASLTTSNIASSEFEGKFTSQCSIKTPSAPLDYTSLSSVQETSTIYYSKLESTCSIAINPFTAHKSNQGVPNPVYTYSLKSFNDASYQIGIAPSTGVISLPSISSLGDREYTLVVEGVIQDCQTTTVSLTLIGLTSTPPKFQDQFIPLSDLIALQNRETYYQLPNIIYLNKCQTPTLSILNDKGTLFPHYLDFTDSSNKIIKASPPVDILTGNYSILVKIMDTFSSTSYQLNVRVVAPEIDQFSITNIGPPNFIGFPDSLTLEQDISFIYKLPPIQDPDDDQYSIRVFLKDAAYFTKFEQEKLIFFPTAKTALKSEYQFEIALSDKNAKPLSSKYKLKIIVNPKKATNDTKIQPIAILKQTYTCSIRIQRITRTGQIELKIMSSNNEAALQIANELAEKDIMVAVNDKPNAQIQIEIVDVQVGNIVVIKVQFDEKDEISAGMVRLHQITEQYRIWTRYNLEF